MVGLPGVILNESFSAQMTVRCCCLDDWCKPAVVGAVESPLTLYPYRVSVPLFFFCFFAGRAVIIFAELPTGKAGFIEAHELYLRIVGVLSPSRMSVAMLLEPHGRTWPNPFAPCQWLLARRLVRK